MRLVQFLKFTDETMTRHHLRPTIVENTTREINQSFFMAVMMWQSFYKASMWNVLSTTTTTGVPEVTESYVIIESLIIQLLQLGLVVPELDSVQNLSE